MTGATSTPPPAGDADVPQILASLVGEVEAARSLLALLSAAVAGLAVTAPQPARDHAIKLLALVAEGYEPAGMLAAFPGARDAARITAIRCAAQLVEAMTPTPDRPPSARLFQFPGPSAAPAASVREPAPHAPSPTPNQGAPPPGSRLPNSGMESSDHE